MAAITEINFTAMASIITACVAATPPILTSATNIAFQVRELTQKHRSPSLKISKITRVQVSERTWKRVKRNFLVKIYLLVAAAFFIAANTFLYRFGFKHVTLSEFGVVGTLFGLKINIIVLLNFIFFCLYSIAYRNALKRMGREAKEARYFLFQKALLVVDSDMKTTTNKCYETLRLIGSRVIEFNPESSIMEGCTSNELASVFGGLYRIKISDKVGDYMRTDVEVMFLSNESDKTMNLRKSSSINRFIRIFIGN